MLEKYATQKSLNTANRKTKFDLLAKEEEEENVLRQIVLEKERKTARVASDGRGIWDDTEWEKLNTSFLTRLGNGRGK